MGTEKFTACFRMGNVTGEISVEALDFKAAEVLINHVVEPRGQWSLMWDENNNEFFNDNLETIEVDLG